MKIAFVHNCDWRNNGTATYALRAMKEIDGVEAFHVRSPCSGEIPKADLYISVDDGRDDIKFIPPSPNVFWAVDTHLGLGFRLWKAKQYDHVFIAQKDDLHRFEKEGIKAHWLPLACHPEAHPNRNALSEKLPYEDLGVIWDIAFVGFMNNGDGGLGNNRVDWLDTLFQEFPNSWLATGVFFEDMAIRFVKAKLGYNVSIKNDLNMRVFEVMSTGTPLLTNRNVVGIDDLFTEGVHYFGYETKAEMIDVARRALNDERLRNDISSSAQGLVRTKHTYHDRMGRILEEVNARS